MDQLGALGISHAPGEKDMLKKLNLLVLASSLFVASGAMAADISAQPTYADVPPQAFALSSGQDSYSTSGGWYLRGDINHHWSQVRGIEYITYGSSVPEPGTNQFTWTDLSGAWSLGAGVGYQINQHVRTDLTADYWFKSDFRGATFGDCSSGPCTSSDWSSYRALLLMANAYIDLGTYAGVTPYVGGGIGGAWVKWNDLTNETEDGSWVHRGGKGWRFAWSLMAGASYCLTDSLELDAGYRFTRINGGKMFDYTSYVGPGFDKGFNVHEARAGLRYSFGGPSLHCAPQPQEVAYQQPAYDPPAPVYKY